MQLILSGDNISATSLHSYGGCISELASHQGDLSPSESVKRLALSIA